VSGARPVVRIEPDRVDRLQWAVQLRSNRPGAAWCLASDWWLYSGEAVLVGGKCLPRYLLFATRAQARSAAQQLRWKYMPDCSGWPEKPATLWRVVRVRERINVID
jgi:hypothetical protein